MKLNCKPGDLAAVSRTHPPATIQFLGRFVRVRASRIRDDGDSSWTYDEMPLRGKYRRQHVEWHELPDEWLRPIRADGLTTEDVTELYAPSAPEKVSSNG